MFAGAWGTFAGNSLQWSDEGAALLGVASATVAGIGKELMDMGEHWAFDINNGFDTMDLAATTLGGVLGAGLSYAALKIFKKKPLIYGNINKGIEIGVKLRF